MSRRFLSVSLLVIAILAATMTRASAGTVLSDSLHWWTISTSHFNIHYHDGLHEVAAELAESAERSWSILQQEFGQAPDKIDLVIDARTDTTNGYTEPLFDHITIYTANIRWADVGNARANSWLEALLFHELVHEVDCNQARGASRVARWILGKAVMPNQYKPLGFIEGLAVYEKYKHLGHSRANDSRTLMMARTMIIEDSIPDLEEIEYRFEREDWPSSGQLYYNFASLFVKYVEDRYGDDTMRLIAQIRSSALPYVGMTFDTAFRRVTGDTLTYAYYDFIAYLYDEFGAALDGIMESPVTQAEKLTEMGHTVTSPSWSPDGTSIIYEHSSASRSGTRMVDVATLSDVEVMSNIASRGLPMFPHRQGNRIAFVRPHWNNGPNVVYDAYLLDLSTGIERRLTRGERAYLVRLSHDGSAAYIATNLGTDGSTAMKRVNIDTGKVELVASFDDRRGSVHSFDISPDGSKLAVALWANGGQHVYLLDVAHGSIDALTGGYGQDSDPAFTSDGKKIIFSSDPDGVYNIYSVDLESKEVCKLTNVLTGAFFPAPNPAGDRLAYVGYTGEGYDIFLTTLSPSSSPNPSPSPDPGRFTAVHTDTEGKLIPPAGAAISAPVPYNPLRSLVPKVHVPMYDGETLSLMLIGAEPVWRTMYTASLGWRFADSTPVFALDLQNSGIVKIPWQAHISIEPGKHNGSLSLVLPLWSRVGQMQQINLSAAHAAAGSQSMVSVAAQAAYSGAWGHDMLHTRLTALAGAEGSMRLSSSEVIPSVWGELTSSTRVPIKANNLLQARVSAGWTGSQHADDQFIVGGESGRFALRGLSEGYLSGNSAAAASLSFGMQLAAVERAFLGRTLFIDDLQATVFTDVASAGDGISMARSALTCGVELGISIVPLYTSDRVLVSIGLAGPVLHGSEAPEPQSHFQVYLKIGGPAL